MNMESIEKLRYYIDHGINHRDELIKLIDVIEREIAEKYMLLPVVDGRPVHIGDELEWTDGYEPYERFTVGMIGRTYCDESYQDFADTHEHGISFGCCRWPKSDPIKKLLEDYAGKRFARSNMGLDIERLADDYAAKIREAVGGR